MSRTFREGGNMSVLIKGMEMPKDGVYWCEIGVAGEIATITIHGKDRKAFPLIQIPTDVAPVVHGHWERGEDKYFYWYKCSNCGKEVVSKYNNIVLSNYCSHCGAKMDEVAG